MLDNFFVSVSDVTYVHPLLVVLVGLVCSWLPSLFGGIYRLLRPILSALAALIRKFTIF